MSTEHAGPKRKVLEIIQLRAKSGSRPTQRSDPHHVALVIEGGGMRGVAVGGMVSALERLGLRDAFDSVHGSSAGAVAASYFVAGQAAKGTTIYYEDLNNRLFIDPWRAPRHRPIMDVSYLINNIMILKKPLNFNIAVRGDIPVYVVMTDVERQEVYIKHHFDSDEDFRTCLKATVTMPFIGGPPVRHDGRLLYDGGLVQQIAIRSARAAGATHLLVLMTRKQDEVFRRVLAARQRVEAAALALLYGRNVAKLYTRRNVLINRDIEFMLDEDRQNAAGIDLLPIFLSNGMDYLHRLTVDSELLRKGAAEGARIIEKLFP
jgi:predicted patatin/cPLA2 family phospholipase